MTTPHISSLVKNKTIAVYDSHTMPFKNQSMSHFALTDTLIEKAGKTGEIILHFWPTTNTVFLGMQDTKLPYFKEALSIFEEQDYNYIVRNSGGLGVVGDEGVLNFSIILPAKNMDDVTIDEGYEIMYSLINEVFDVQIDATEVADSYCPGDFDLSIKGQKISGISQRRRANGLAIMMYLSIEGNQQKRSQMMQDFYSKGLQGEDSKWHFPYVNPELMINVNDALKKEITTDDVITEIKETLKSYDATLIDGIYTDELHKNYSEQFDKMIARNEKMLGDKFVYEGDK